jgi:DNA-binding MarR family transcriptional regulator
LLKTLAAKKLVSASRDRTDNRVSWVKVTKSGRAVLHDIDEQVQIHVDYFTRGLTDKETEAALSVLLFYAGVSFQRPAESKNK